MGVVASLYRKNMEVARPTLQYSSILITYVTLAILLTSQSLSFLICKMKVIFALLLSKGLFRETSERDPILHALPMLSIHVFIYYILTCLRLELQKKVEKHTHDVEWYKIT